MKVPKGFKTKDELRKMSIKQLHEEREAMEKKRFRDTFEVHSGQNKRGDLPSKDRHQVARIKTILKEKETSEAQAPKPTAS